MRIVAALAVTASLLAAGCGRGGDRARVASVTERFFAALEQGDGGAACALLADNTRTELEHQQGRACDVAITQLELSAGRIARVEVYVTSARALLSGGQSAFLGQGPEGWRLAAVGCRPDGPPDEMPFRCEVQA